MRVSASENDPDFWGWKRFSSGTCSVVFNGDIQRHVIEASDTEGYVRRFVVDEDGSQVIDRDGNLKIEIVYGQVAIVPFSLC